MSQIQQIWVIFTHLKLWVAIARHNFKWMKNKLGNTAGKGLTVNETTVTPKNLNAFELFGGTLSPVFIIVIARSK